VLFFVEEIPKETRRKKSSFTLTAQDKKTIFSLLFYFFFLFFFFSDSFFAMQAKEVGISTAFIPLLFALSALMQTLTSYFFGVLIDRYGVEKMMLFAYFCAVASTGLLFVGNPLCTWMAFGLFGLFTVASLNANRTFIAQNAENQGSVYGVFYAGVALFGAFGAYVSGIIWEHFGMHSAISFSLCGTLFLVLLFTGRRYVRS
jgi:MFS family permease